MHVPDEFYTFCLWLHQDCELYGPEVEDWIHGALRHVLKERQPVLKAFLNEILTGDYTDAQLAEIYRNTDADLGIREGGIRYFLTVARDSIV